MSQWLDLAWGQGEESWNFLLITSKLLLPTPTPMSISSGTMYHSLLCCFVSTISILICNYLLMIWWWTDNFEANGGVCRKITEFKRHVNMKLMKRACLWRELVFDESRTYYTFGLLSRKKEVFLWLRGPNIYSLWAITEKPLFIDFRFICLLNFVYYFTQTPPFPSSCPSS